MKTTDQLRGDLARKIIELTGLKNKSHQGVANLARIAEVKKEIAFIKQCLRVKEQTETK